MLGEDFDRLAVFTKPNECNAKVAQHTAFPSPVPQLMENIETLCEDFESLIVILTKFAERTPKP